MASNNYYYRTIYEILYDTTVEEFHNDIWYLKEITKHYNYTDPQTKCKGKYLRELAERITSEEYDSSHTNNFYLRRIANNLSGVENKWLTENYYLKIISEYIGGNKTPTLLTLETPMLVYTDVFDVEGKLTDDLNQPISGADIILEWTVDGITRTATAQTNPNGVVTFHNSSVTTVHEYTFKLRYSGSRDYSHAVSGEVSVTPNAEVSVINITTPLSGGTVYTDGDVPITGTFKTDDDETIGNKEILIKENDVTIKTITTTSGGVINTTLTGLSEGVHTLVFHYVGSSEYSEHTLSRSFTVTQPTLTGDKSILSFADGDDKCIITAHYNQSGKNVKLYDYSDDSEIGTMTDNGDGTYSYEYDSEGVGDRTFYAKYSTFLTKTFAIEDCSDCQELTSNAKESRWDIPSVVRNSTFGYNSNGWKYGNSSSYSRIYYVNTFNAPISVEFQVNEISSNALVVEVQDQNKANGLYVQYNHGTHLWNGAITNVTQTLNTGSIVRVEFHSNQIKVYVDDTLLTTGTITLHNTFYLNLHIGSNRYIRIKDLKIKPL